MNINLHANCQSETEPVSYSLERFCNKSNVTLSQNRMSSTNIKQSGDDLLHREVASGSAPTKNSAEPTLANQQTTHDDDDEDEDGDDEDFTEEADQADVVEDEGGPSTASRRTRRLDVEAQGDGDEEGDHQVEDDELKYLKREAEEDNATGQERGRGKRLRKVQEDQKQSLLSQSISEDSASKAWSDFLSSTDATESKGEETITITEKYTFANEVQTRQRTLPRSHPDAIAYLEQQQRKQKNHQPSQPLPPSTSAHTSSSAPPEPVPKPKKRTSKLSKLSSDLAAEAPKKLNTLEKSSLDWSNSLNDTEKQELNDQSLGKSRDTSSMSGYLQRRDFLERVTERTAERR
ncbi:unnamed protein product [Sympodiomycopsis kandeliae]